LYESEGRDLRLGLRRQPGGRRRPLDGTSLPARSDIPAHSAGLLRPLDQTFLPARRRVTLAEVYGLVVCGDSIHWFDWPVVFERFRRCLAPPGSLAIVQRRWRLGDVDTERLAELYAEHSANRHFVPLDPVTALESRGLFEKAGSHTTAAVACALRLLTAARVGRQVPRGTNGP
jgi:SAM-dependent methyltransferase